MYKKYIKRILDIIISVFAIILLMPVYLIISILVAIFMGFPILFKQERVGENEKIFNIYKFRTMTNKKNKDGTLLPDSERVTKFGRFLRKTSLDELPELFQILKGNMSLVGPRPLLVRYLPYYNERERKRHNIKPGLTGLAQINGRNSLQWEDRFDLDVKYVENVSFLLDCKIVILTIKKVIFSENIILAGEGKIKAFDVYRKEQNESYR